MHNLSRREFGVPALALGAQVGGLFGASSIDDALRTGMERHRIPAAVAIVCGLTQVRIWIPPQSPVSDRVPVLLTMDREATQPNVFIAIK